MGDTKSSAKERYAAWTKTKVRMECFLRGGQRKEAELLRIINNTSGETKQQAYEDLIHFKMGFAQGGDRIAAEFVLREFCRKTQNGESVPAALSWWIGLAIAKMLNGMNAKEAFCLSAGKGRPKKATVLRDMNLFDTVLLKRSEGKTYEDAVNETAEENAVSESTVKRAHECFNNMA